MEIFTSTDTMVKRSNGSDFMVIPHQDNPISLHCNTATPLFLAYI